MKPDVTIIIPTWNSGHLIGNAIVSALAQHDLTIEIVVVDDASTDGTNDVVTPLCGAAVRYLRLPANKGPSAARNAALSIARGRWIAVLDADDTMIPQRLSTLIRSAEMLDLDIITDNMWIAKTSGVRQLFYDEDLDGTLERVQFREYVLRNLMFGPKLGDGYLKPVFRAEFLKRNGLRYDESMRIGEDFILLASALAQGARYGRHHSAGYVYTTSSGSISHRLGALQAAAMVTADLNFVAKFGPHLTAPELSALHLHLRRLQEGAAFIRMVDAVKAHNLQGFVSEAVYRPKAVRHFAMPIRARLARFGICG